MNDTPAKPAFDTAAAVTRSLLGWGVVAGGFYLVVGVVLALTREGFDFARHPLSLLMLGDLGWIQKTNLILSGLMAIAASVGFARALRGSRTAAWAGGLIGGYGLCLVGGGVFPPDPMAGFPEGSATTAPSVGGMLHFGFGALAFLLIAIAGFVVAAWQAGRGDARWAWYSRISAIVVIVGFVGGGAMATQTLGVVGLWITVVAGWVWLAAASVHAYRTVPHPDGGGA